MRRKIKSHLHDIPPPLLPEVLRCMRPYRAGDFAGSLAAAIDHSCCWADTPIEDEFIMLNRRYDRLGREMLRSDITIPPYP